MAPFMGGSVTLSINLKFVGRPGNKLLLKDFVVTAELRKEQCG